LQRGIGGRLLPRGQAVVGSTQAPTKVARQATAAFADTSGKIRPTRGRNGLPRFRVDGTPVKPPFGAAKILEFEISHEISF